MMSKVYFLQLDTVKYKMQNMVHSQPRHPEIAKVFFSFKIRYYIVYVIVIVICVDDVCIGLITYKSDTEPIK